MFTDFKGFTKIAEKLTPQELLYHLQYFFSSFDSVIEKYNLEKIKTIGDSYMACGGIPIANETHAIDCVLAAMEMHAIVDDIREIISKKNLTSWELRIGINSGNIITGVVGNKKFIYDIFGDSVNIASRMQAYGAPGKINISRSTYDLVKEFFDCEYRGKLEVKNRGELEMYYVNGIKCGFSRNEEGRVIIHQKTP